MASLSTPTTGASAINTDLSARETVSLIAASKVKGASVYNPDGETLGSIYDVMIDKRSGQVTFAVLSFGGFLGIGEKYHPLPWHVLTYDERYGGYVVRLSRDLLERAPSYGPSDIPAWDEPRYGQSIDDYYSRTGLI